jgi:hypothetical protein
LNIQQARSYAIWQLPQYNAIHHHVVINAEGRVEGMSTKCDDDDEKYQVAAKRVKVASIVGIFLIIKYSFWNYFYEKFKKRD